MVFFFQDITSDEHLVALKIEARWFVYVITIAQNRSFPLSLFLFTLQVGKFLDFFWLLKMNNNSKTGTKQSLFYIKCFEK